MFERSQEMANKGYNYILTDKQGKLTPLYAKTLADIGNLMRDFPENRFNVTNIFVDYSVAELLKLWKNNKSAVVRMLKEDHPGLTATFIAQGLADRHLTIADVNTIANLLTEERMKFFQQS